MERRDFLIGATTSVAAMAMAKASLADMHAHDHGAAMTADPRVDALRESTLACQEAAADCVRHCIASLGAGDKSLAACMESVLRMQAITGAMHDVAASEAKPSERAQELAAVCAGFCKDCAAECEPHAEKHAACKACLDACLACVEACEAYAA
ncbi:MAG: Csp1 family four helix bundle copper storage protein [Myxococcota bacterium]